ncbi:hypothetical protein LOAG_09729, partial [Loa loa]
MGIISIAKRDAVMLIVLKPGAVADSEEESEAGYSQVQCCKKEVGGTADRCLDEQRALPVGPSALSLIVVLKSFATMFNTAALCSSAA